MPGIKPGMTVLSSLPDSILQSMRTRFPGAAQHEAKRNDALQTRDLCKCRVCDDPGPAVHRFTLHRIRETRPAW